MQLSIQIGLNYRYQLDIIDAAKHNKDNMPIDVLMFSIWTDEQNSS